ncbi:MAG: glycosyltransferase family 4 protein [Methanobacteriaceae archaeon]|nr:glycosyltransferase family 4 protein [Methanobacteriaceae archaeon]
MKKRILMIIPFHPSIKGGVIRAVKSQKKVYEKLGFNTDILYADNIDEADSYDLIQVHGPLKVKSLLKLIKANAKLVLTLHGWVVDESITALKENPRKDFHHIFRLFNWILHRLIFIPLIYKGRVTAVSRITMEKNGVKGVVIPNAFIPADVDKKVAKCKNLSFDDFTFVTYVSMGGSKVGSIPRLSRIITEVNKRTDRKIQLLVFGDPVEIDNPHIKMMGYQDDFLCYLKSADMMLLGYEMSELGYAVMEAGYLSVPIAKFKGKFEELKDGVHGIIAENEEDMIKKLLEAIENPLLAREWGENLRKYILETRSPEKIMKKWQEFLESI